MQGPHISVTHKVKPTCSNLQQDIAQKGNCRDVYVYIYMKSVMYIENIGHKRLKH